MENDPRFILRERLGVFIKITSTITFKPFEGKNISQKATEYEIRIKKLKNKRKVVEALFITINYNIDY